ncbi:palmitoyltransferase swf1 [Didymosphaeria variabile]|uniref:Palmitoyltransferase swf1 n=1 Tax=Didymosphaeria variabile TaxID=1932322 RepID=A0A9W8XFA8_9PLEO|nr:palmitoyltransferase swf1 [Didymosphaeria variabile]KAJ4349586.1 palmitoyltransferase swf1 [Didymosphaeria variabile]
MSRAVSKKEQSQQIAHQHQGQEQHARDVETTEHKSSANASAGLNLNLFGALSGALSSTKRKETTNKPDGSKHTIEDSHDKAAASGYAAGQGNAFAQGNTQDGGKHEKRREIGQKQEQGKIVAGQKQSHKVDHLGIEN